MNNDLFVEVTEQEYDNFLVFLDRNFNGYRYVSNIMANKTSIYLIDDAEHKNEIAYRRVREYGNSDTYFLRKWSRIK